MASNFASNDPRYLQSTKYNKLDKSKLAYTTKSKLH